MPWGVKMKANFAKGLQFVFIHEGYKTNASDPGGRTIWGISWKAYPIEVDQMWDLPKEQSQEIAAGIYLRDYWNKVDGDNLPQGMDLFLFDTSVNMGVAKALSLAEGNDNVFDYLIARLRYYVTLAQSAVYKPFLRGWITRVLDLWEIVK
jgi:hypothetical protein